MRNTMPVTNPYAGITCLPNNTGTGRQSHLKRNITLNPGTYCTGGIELKTRNRYVEPRHLYTSRRRATVSIVGGEWHD